MTTASVDATRTTIAPWLGPALVLPLFFSSGFAAILYQVVWQRTLFAAVGINVEAVTLIVTAFILGLGVGSLLGGRLSRAEPGSLIARFATLELAVGLFGVLSLPLMRSAGTWAASLPPLATGPVTFAILLLPTLGMGATLPVLVAYHVRRSGNVGTAVGALYFANTLGSAVAAFTAGYVLLPVLGQSGVVSLAVACNITVAASALAFLQWGR